MRKSRKVALIAACVAGGTVLLAVGAAIVLTGGANTPEPVPSGWTRPVALPVSAPLAADRFAFDSDRTGSFEVFTAGTDGGSPVQLTSDPVYDSWSPRVSPDRRTILFYRAPAGKHDLDQSIVSLWAIAADGSGPVELRPAGLDGWVLQGHAEWAPDARTLVMFGGSRINPQIQITDALGQGPHAITDRGGTNLDPSFSPDGTQVVFVGCAQSICREPDYEIYRIPVAGGEATRLTDDSLRDQDPYFSPDGTRLAWRASGCGTCGSGTRRAATPSGCSGTTGSRAGPRSRRTPRASSCTASRQGERGSTCTASAWTGPARRR